MYLAETSRFLAVVISISLGMCSIPSDVRVSYSLPGDFFIAGLFPFHFSEEAPCDTSLSTWAVELSQTMVYAVEEINRRSDLLPNVTLGLEIRDDCYSESMTLFTVLSLMGRNGRLAQLDIPGGVSSRWGNSTFLGAIGPVSSSNSILAGMSGSLFRVPIISYLATSDELSDKHRFPFFLRSTPPDKLNAQAIIDILLRFGWDYVALIYSLDSYGIRGAQEVQKLAEQDGVCLAFSSPISSAPSKDDIDEIVQKLRLYKHATVVVVFAAIFAPYAVLDEFRRQEPGSNLTFVGSAAFESVYRQNKISLSENTVGGMFVPLQYQEIDGFAEYFRTVGRSEQPPSPWFEEFQSQWLTANSCSDIDQCPPPSINNDEIFVMNAVNVFAHALHNVLNGTCRGNVTCASEIASMGERFLPYLLRVNFEGTDGPFHFDHNGEPIGRYTLQNVQITNGQIETAQIGVWDSLKSTDRLSVDEKAVTWAGGVNTPPRSTCREKCKPGYIKVPLEQKCCWGCQKCPYNAITRNGTRCVLCEATQWPNHDHTRCDSITPAAITWSSPSAIVILLLSTSGLALTSSVAAGIFHYRHHGLIKATSRELSAIQVGGLFLSFVTSIVTLARPSEVSCPTIVNMLFLCLTVTYSATLLKVNRIYRIFKASKKSTKRPSWTSPRTQVTIAFIFISVQIMIAVISISLNSTHPALLVQVPARNYIELYCLFGYEALVSCVYNLLLGCTCCYYAYRARKVPSNYNESKFIAANVYSMLVFCLAAMPVYITATTANQKVVTLCVVILLNAYSTLFMAFVPKLYAVRFVRDLGVSGTGTGETFASAASTMSHSRRVFPASQTAIERVDTSNSLPPQSVAGTSGIRL